MPTSSATTRHLLTVSEAAERLNLSVSTVRRRIWDGELPAVRLGSGPQPPVRIDPDALEDWLHTPRPAVGAASPVARPPLSGLEGKA